MVDSQGNFSRAEPSVEVLAAKKGGLSAHEAMKVFDSALTPHHSVRELLEKRGNQHVREGLVSRREGLMADIPKFGEPAVHGQVELQRQY